MCSQEQVGIGQDEGNEKRAGGPNLAAGPMTGNASGPPQTAVPDASAATSEKHQDFFAATKTTHIWQVARLLLAGKPVPKSKIAEELGLDAGHVDATLQQVGPGVEYDENGDLVSFAVSLTPTPHHYTVDGVPLYVWCAGDALAFPALFGHTADVDSPALARRGAARCAYFDVISAGTCGEKIRARGPDRCWSYPAVWRRCCGR